METGGSYIYGHSIYKMKIQSVYYRDIIDQRIENGDWVCIINQEVKVDTGELYLTFKMLKRRYRSSDDDEKLRRLDYFNHPYEKGNEIRLVDDVDLPDSLSLYSLSSSFASLEETKRGKKNAVERKSNKNDDDFDPFDIEKVFN